MFQDFDLHLEFLLPYMPAGRDQGRGNSGVYRRAVTKSVRLDSFAEPPTFSSCGSLYRFRELREHVPAAVAAKRIPDIAFTARGLEFRRHQGKQRTGHRLAQRRGRARQRRVARQDGGGTARRADAPADPSAGSRQSGPLPEHLAGRSRCRAGRRISGIRTLRGRPEAGDPPITNETGQTKPTRNPRPPKRPNPLKATRHSRRPWRLHGKRSALLERSRTDRDRCARSGWLPPPGGRERPFRAEHGAVRLESQGIDRQRLGEAVRYLEEHSGRDGSENCSSSVTAASCGKGRKVDRQHGIWSMTKSFTSTSGGAVDRRRQMHARHAGLPVRSRAGRCLPGPRRLRR